MKELDEYGLLIRSSGGFSKPNHLYMRIPCIELTTTIEKAKEYTANWNDMKRNWNCI